jgi:hypothetical protein
VNPKPAGYLLSSRGLQQRGIRREAIQIGRDARTDNDEVSHIVMSALLHA